MLRRAEFGDVFDDILGTLGLPRTGLPADQYALVSVGLLEPLVGAVSHPEDMRAGIATDSNVGVDLVELKIEMI